jgi:rod shape-determining protein MreD
VTRLLVFGLMFAAALVQVTWAPHLQVYGAFPNLVLAAVVCITWLGGPRAGLLWACVGGLLLDLTAPGPLGPHALALVVGAYAVGFWVRNVRHASLVQPALAATAASALYSLILIGTDDTLGLPVPPLGLVLQLATAACVYNAALVTLALVPLRRLAEQRIEAA